MEMQDWGSNIEVKTLKNFCIPCKTLLKGATVGYGGKVANVVG